MIECYAISQKTKSQQNIPVHLPKNKLLYPNQLQRFQLSEFGNLQLISWGLQLHQVSPEIQKFH